MSDLDVLRRVLAAARAGESPDAEDLDAADAALADGRPAATALQKGRVGRPAGTPFDLVIVRKVAAVLEDIKQGTRTADAWAKFDGFDVDRQRARYRLFLIWLAKYEVPLAILTQENIALFADAYGDEDEEFLREVLADE